MCILLQIPTEKIFEETIKVTPFSQQVYGFLVVFMLLLIVGMAWWIIKRELFISSLSDKVVTLLTKIDVGYDTTERLQEKIESNIEEVSRTLWKQGQLIESIKTLADSIKEMLRNSSFNGKLGKNSETD